MPKDNLVPCFTTLKIHTVWCCDLRYGNAGHACLPENHCWAARSAHYWLKQRCVSHKMAALKVPLPQHVSGSSKSDKCTSDSGCRCLKPQVCQVTNPGHGRTNISHTACQDCHAGGACLMTLGSHSRLRVICMQKGQALSCPLLPSSVQPPAPASWDISYSATQTESQPCSVSS